MKIKLITMKKGTYKTIGMLLEIPLCDYPVSCISNGLEIYTEDTEHNWLKKVYDKENNLINLERGNSFGVTYRKEFTYQNGVLISTIDTNGKIENFIQTVEMTMDEIIEKFGYKIKVVNKRK